MLFLSLSPEVKNHKGERVIQFPSPFFYVIFLKRNKMKRSKHIKGSRIITGLTFQFGALLFLILIAPSLCFGQAIEGGSGWASPYIKSLSRVFLAGGGILGVVGAIKIYIKWNSGHQHIADDIMYWGGSCVALVLISIFCNYLF